MNAKNIGIILMLLLLMIAPFCLSSFYSELIITAMIMAIFAMSLDLLVGVTGLVSFGHAAWFGIGAYILALYSTKVSAISLWISLPLAMLISAFFAFLVGILVLRTKGVYFIMSTLAFAQMGYYLFHDTSLGGGSDGIYVNIKPIAALGFGQKLDMSQELQMYFIVLAILFLVYIFLKRLLVSSFGTILQGIHDNEQRMRSLGYATFYYKLAAFSLAGALAGLAGYLHAELNGFVTPELLSWHKSGDVLLMVILGGMGNFIGAIAGAFVLIGLHELFSTWTKHWQLLMGLMIVFLVLFMPGGLSSFANKILKLKKK